MRKLLIVSPHFPPVNAPDGHRARLLAAELRDLGWEPVVLACHPDSWNQNIDETLPFPSDIEIIRVHAMPAKWTAWCGLRNLGWRALPTLFLAGLRRLNAERFDAVLFSTTQFICLALGPLWKQRTGVPFVVDLQDAWRTDFYERPGAPPPPGGRKYLFAKSVASLLEGPILRRAAGILSVTPAYIEQCVSRYRSLDQRKTMVLPMGVSTSDAARALEIVPAVPDSGFVYFGRLGDDMETALRALLEAFATHRPKFARTAIDFVGTSYARPGETSTPVERLARVCGVGDAVHEDSARAGYMDALARLQRAQLVVVLGSADLDYMPSKLDLALRCARAVVVVADARSVLAERVRLESPQCLATYESIGEWLERFANDPSCARPTPGSGLESREMSDLFVKFLERVVAIV